MLPTIQTNDSTIAELKTTTTQIISSRITRKVVHFSNETNDTNDDSNVQFMSPCKKLVFNRIEPVLAYSDKLGTITPKKYDDPKKDRYAHLRPYRPYGFVDENYPSDGDLFQLIQLDLAFCKNYEYLRHSENL
ncbi:10668_t:CDS:2 [Diversispora eburnea]|uniref:10668_t:CDS:1 n=1 Tax=Diversispora eburnea TaxID=1213867 RepID=A0A9N8Z3N7_9GLOM|nr:10668_t:CDS:2 [Diversispora eburnea]